MFAKILSAVFFITASICSDANAYNSNVMHRGNTEYLPACQEQTAQAGSEYEDHAVRISGSIPQLTAVAGSKISIPLIVENIGKSSFNTLELIVDVNGKRQNVTFNSEKQITRDHKFNLELSMPAITGDIPVRIVIDRIDGVKNNSTNRATEGKIKVLSRKVDHKVVIEEFTGFWCGWCPKGIVGMEKVKQVYGDKVVVVTVHHNDALDCKDYETLANQTVSTYPQAHVDRTIMSVDPYYGSSLYKVFGIGLDVDTRAAVAPVAEVTAEGNIDGDILTAKADVKFLYTGDTHHALAFVLTENNMKNDKWIQDNFLTQWKGQPIEELEPMFDKWINGSPKMEGIVFDDVAMAAMGLDGGIAGSIPSYVKEEESNIYEVEFDLHKIKKVMNYDELNLCVFLFDTNTGQIENADSKSFGSAAGIDGIHEDTEKVEIARYSVDGRRISDIHKGLNIIKYSDGSVKKIMIK